MSAPTLDMFTADQKAAITELLDTGMNPEQITGYLSRLNDLDEVAELFLHQLATDLDTGRS